MNLRIRKATFLTLLGLLFASCQTTTAIPISSPTPTHCPTGDFEEQLFSDGQTREYQLHVPDSYQPDKPAALVLAFHGAGSTSEQFESYSGFSTVAATPGPRPSMPRKLSGISSRSIR